MRAIFVAVSSLLLACQGAVGPAGPVGPQGEQGPAGPAGARGRELHLVVASNHVDLGVKTDGNCALTASDGEICYGWSIYPTTYYYEATGCTGARYAVVLTRYQQHWIDSDGNVVHAGAVQPKLMARSMAPAPGECTSYTAPRAVDNAAPIFATGAKATDYAPEQLMVEAR